MVVADTDFLDVLYWMIVFFFWVMVFWLFITVVADIFRRDDMGGWKKAVWLVAIIFVPLLGILVYMLFRPRIVPGQAPMGTDVAPVSGSSVAGEVAKLAELHKQGVLTDAEFAEAKRKAMA